MNRVVSIALGCFLCVVLGTPFTASGMEALALISSLTGKAEVQRLHQNAFRELQLGEELFEGEVIHTHDHSRVSLLFSDGSVYTVYPNSRVTLSLGGRIQKGSSVVSSLSEGMMKGIGGIFKVEKKREALTAVPGIRKKIEEEEMGVRVVHPRNSIILTSRPHFCWTTRGGGGPFMVSLTLKGMGGELWTTETRETAVQYPKQRSALKRGQTYFLRVESREDTDLYDEVYFRVLEDQKAEEVKRVVTEMEALQESNPGDTTPQVLLVIFYMERGLYHQALAELEILDKTKPGERFVLEQRREIFAKIGFWKKWADVNQKLSAP